MLAAAGWFQVIEPALALQQAIAIQVECLLFGVDRVEAKGDFLFRVGRTDAFQQAQPRAFKTIEAHLILMLLGFVERMRQLDRLQRLTIDQIVLQQRGNKRCALGRIGKAVDDRDHIGTRQGFDLQVVDGVWVKPSSAVSRTGSVCMPSASRSGLITYSRSGVLT